LKGHGFSRAAKTAKIKRALAPEVQIPEGAGAFRLLNAVLKLSGFSHGPFVSLLCAGCPTLAASLSLRLGWDSMMPALQERRKCSNQQQSQVSESRPGAPGCGTLPTKSPYRREGRLGAIVGRRASLFALFLLISVLTSGQTTRGPVTNADVIGMTKTGIGESTIVLAIQQGPDKFDTSPQALIELKNAGVTDLVLNAMLAASKTGSAEADAEAKRTNGAALLQRALDAIGPRESLAAIRSVRWKATFVRISQGEAKSVERELLKVYPDKVYMSLQSSTGSSQKQVITPEFNYRMTGKMTTAVPSVDLETLRQQLEFDTLYIAQHIGDYTVIDDGEEQFRGVFAERLRIGKDGREIIWKIDPKSDQILSTIWRTPSGDVVTEYSDYRLVGGVYRPFIHHVTDSAGTTDITMKEYEVNPAIDEKLFQRPSEISTEGLRLKVLQVDSVPYTQEVGGGISTSCNITGSANTSFSANTFGSTTFGNGTTNSNMRMSCNSHDNTIRWQHVLNTMFVEASDGNAYIIACDRAWRWSKCVPLRVGQVFNARFTEKGIAVQEFNTNGKEGEPTYSILQSKSLR
jgi:hypothetical protein